MGRTVSEVSVHGRLRCQAPPEAEECAGGQQLRTPPQEAEAVCTPCAETLPKAPGTTFSSPQSPQLVPPGDQSGKAPVAQTALL